MLAISNEDPGKVSEYVDRNGYTVRTASGSTASGDYGVRGIPAAFLIDPEGKVAWAGHPSGLSKGTVKEVLKKAEKLPENAFLVVKPSMEIGPALEDAAAAARAGKLGKALEKARAAKESGADDAAGALVAEIEGHLELLLGQAADSLERYDMVSAVTVYEAVADEVPGTTFAASAAEVLEKIEKDPELSRELEAAEAFAKTRDAAAKLSTSKKRGKYEKFAKKYEGTKAADRVKTILRGL